MSRYLGVLLGVLLGLPTASGQTTPPWQQAPYLPEAILPGSKCHGPQPLAQVARPEPAAAERSVRERRQPIRRWCAYWETCVGTRLCAAEQMPQRRITTQPDDAPYYYRPYQWAHVLGQQETATGWDFDPHNPYDNRTWLESINPGRQPAIPRRPGEMPLSAPKVSMISN